MIRVIFKNVGQGDSIILEWQTSNRKSVGIIDSNLHNGDNPILNYLIENQVSIIDFIILTHFHYDHFSGMPDIFSYCQEKNIKINLFIHTFASQVLDIYNRILTPKKVETAAKNFFKYFDELADKNIGDIILADCYTSPIQLSDKEYLSFCAPSGKIYHQIAKNISRKTNNIIISYPDINKLSALTCVYNNTEYLLLTSDSVRQSFRFINKKIDKELVAIQVPHHGSYSSISPNYWGSVRRKSNCPAIFSVGDEPKDRLPDVETVEFIDQQGFDIHSTNLVYGLCDYFYKSSNLISNSKKTCLDLFSQKRIAAEKQNKVNEKYIGDKVLELL